VILARALSFLLVVTVLLHCDLTALVVPHLSLVLKFLVEIVVIFRQH